MTRTPISISGAATASGLLAAGALHVVWATGSTFPFGTREALNDTVIGRQVAPGPAECLAVAALLTTAAGAVVGAGRGHGPSRVAASGVGAVLALVRARWSTSEAIVAHALYDLVLFLGSTFDPGW